MMSFEVFDSLEKWIMAQKQFFVLDFGGELLPKSPSIGTYLIGPEGGFTEDERELLHRNATGIYGLDTSLILKSETACISIASRFV